MTTDLTVYRIEHRTKGWGPFWDGAIDIGHLARDMPSPCTPGQEGIAEFMEARFEARPCGAVSANVAFGFLSTADLRKWFDRADLHRLACKGFDLLVYTVPDRADAMARTDAQIIFDRGTATVKTRLPLTDLGGTNEL